MAARRLPLQDSRVGERNPATQLVGRRASRRVARANWPKRRPFYERNASVAYTTATATYVVFKNGGKPVGCPTGQTGGLSAIKISKASPPVMSLAWCGGPATATSPAMSMSRSAGADSLVWIVGSDNKLYGVDGDTGANVFTGATALPAFQNTQTPIVAKGRVFVASAAQVTAFVGN